MAAEDETTTFDYGAPAELFMAKRKGGSRQPLGYRRFATAAEAICHSPGLPSSRIGASSDTSPPRRPFMSTTSCSVTPRRLAMSLTWSGRRSPSSRAEILLLALRRLKKSFFWVVPIFTSDHERRIYSWIAALIHQMA